MLLALAYYEHEQKCKATHAFNHDTVDGSSPGRPGMYKTC